MACATESPMSQYYCHECQTEIRPNPDYTCPRCQNGFIEELSPELAHSHEDPSSVVYSVIMPDDEEEEYDFAESSSSRYSRNSRNRRHGRYAVTSNPRFIRRGSGGHQHNIILAGSSEHGSLDFLVQHLLQNMMGGGSTTLLNFPELHGNLEDYAFSEATFDRIITQLMNRFENCGPPPATDDEIKKLSKKKVTNEMLLAKTQCHVCLEEYQENEDVTNLPCSHIFHSECIEPWLSKHGTCPICRKTLSGEDTSTGNFTPDLSELANTSLDQNQPGPSNRN